MQSTETKTSFIENFPIENPKKANLEIIESWLKRQDSREEAYITMGEALIAADLSLIATEVLDYPSTKNGSKKRKLAEMMGDTESSDGANSSQQRNCTGYFVNML